MTRSVSIALILLTAGLVAGCDPVTGTLIGAGAEVGVAAGEERGVGGALTDTKIQTDIDAEYLNKGFDIFRDVTVTVQEGRVDLTGKVKTPEEQVEAVRLAWQAAGVRQVIDDLQVTDTSGMIDYGRDVRIATTLRTQLLFDKYIRNINYSVDVVNATVYLMGIAQDQAELDRVIAHARDIGGVKNVINNVILKTDPARKSS
ncbi:MAG TPA: BON domain-containing protein [Magnetospirillaceae bacterium]